MPSSPSRFCETPLKGCKTIDFDASAATVGFESNALFVAAQHQFRIKLSFTGNSIKEFDSCSRIHELETSISCSYYEKFILKLQRHFALAVISISMVCLQKL
uniref:Uncharacterized protein n=1 Tax=Oxyrrhis marina TaxID=2969 RepID=A0A7S4GNI2_OXYMA